MTLSQAGAEEIRDLTIKAAPSRLKIMDDLNKKMTFLRQSFVLHFVKNIDKKKDKENYIETKIQQEKLFRKIKDYIYYEGKPSINPRYDGLNKLENLMQEALTAVQYLQYIGHTENLEDILSKFGAQITVRPLENAYPELADEVVKDNVVKIFESADELQSEICNASNHIKITVYQELDDQIKYDSKHNKTGLKANEFDRLTTLEATRQKSEELAEKKYDSLNDSIINGIESNKNTQLVAHTIVKSE